MSLEETRDYFGKFRYSLGTNGRFYTGGLQIVFAQPAICLRG
ncbi:Hypothetical protein DEACI_2913 [Acididesulfobacillus acetoxydans]|uniref:Uncharacterized protein n=1 Tax=Acididesulfobacillus acetoxydans TaxID=1561005 RepID=A0A8S0X661_9FIRM|nr:Hypothetical protein DEACI_2913 [Acididesulfobacillus acetoxydans]CEJ07542.1 Hypothetical protein DEACI_2008 [Acididesulfobacillus acetoxydans]